MTRSKQATTGLDLVLDTCGRTAREVAQDLDMDPTLLSRYRSGERRPSERHGALLAEYFNCSLEELLAPPPYLNRQADTIKASDLLEPEGWID